MTVRVACLVSMNSSSPRAGGLSGYIAELNMMESDMGRDID